MCRSSSPGQSAQLSSLYGHVTARYATRLRLIKPVNTAPRSTLFRGSCGWDSEPIISDLRGENAYRKIKENKRLNCKQGF